MRQKPAPVISSFDLFIFACDPKSTSFVFDAKHAGDFAKDEVRLKAPPTCETDLFDITGVRRVLLPSHFWADVFRIFVPASSASFPVVLDLSAHVGTALVAAVQQEIGYIGVIKDSDSFIQFQKTSENLLLAHCDDQQISVWAQNFEKFIKVSTASKITITSPAPSSSGKGEISDSEDSGEGEEEVDPERGVETEFY